jgi:hypothetical protein
MPSSRAKRLERQRKYDRSPEARARKLLLARLKYNTPEGKAKAKARRESAKYKKYQAAYNKSEKAKAYRREYEQRRSTIERTRQRHLSPAGRYANYKYGAKDRGIPFKISFEYFMTFWQKPCAYDGKPIETIGLDRIDNTKGYVKGNIVPCCFTCNKAKMDRSGKEYIAHCKRVASFSK